MPILAELKQTSDLHSDQLSQAVLLRFAESGELARHLVRTRQDGQLRLIAARNACAAYLPPGSKYTTPEGGMNLWVELPGPLDARDLLAKVQEQGVTFLPGQLFFRGAQPFALPAAEFRRSLAGRDPARHPHFG